MRELVEMMAWMTLGGLGAAVPYAMRSADAAELALYQAVAHRVLELKKG